MEGYGMESIELFFKGDDLRWGISGLGDDLGCGGGRPRDAQEVEVGPYPWDCLRRIHV